MKFNRNFYYHFLARHSLKVSEVTQCYCQGKNANESCYFFDFNSRLLLFHGFAKSLNNRTMLLLRQKC